MIDNYTSTRGVLSTLMPAGIWAICPLIRRCLEIEIDGQVVASWYGACRLRRLEPQWQQEPCCWLAPFIYRHEELSTEPSCQGGV